MHTSQKKLLFLLDNVPISVTLQPFLASICTLADLLDNCYKEYSINYNCPKCNKGGKCMSRIFIPGLLPILILHLNRFEYNISARKKQNYVDFPLRQLSLGEHALSGVNLASYDLCAVSNHHGTMNWTLCKLLQASSRCLVPV